MKLRFIVSTLLLTLVAIFAVQNAEVVDVRFLAWKFSMSRALLLFLAAALGALLYWLIAMVHKPGRMSK